MRPSQALNSRRGPHLTQISENPRSAGILPALLRTSPTLSPRRRADLAPAASADATPPVEQASFHQLVFANEDVAVLNNLYPPGGDSGFHAHHRDLFAVIIQPQPSSSETPGKPLKPATEVQAGTAAYSPVSGEPRVHRVINNSQGPFQIIVIELHRASPQGAATSARKAAPQYVQITDNPRMRAWRLILEPGQSFPAITQGGNGVRVVVRGGLLTTMMPGVPEQTLALQPGNFAVQEKGFTRALRNGGAETIVLVEMELK